MSEISIFAQAAKYGLEIIMSVGVLLLCIWIVKAVVGMAKDQLMNVSRALEKLIDRMDLHSKESQERHQRMSEEHNNMFKYIREKT
jgi:hypothetical protein